MSLSPEIINEISYILEGIKSGKLKHNQETYHSDCGTAHCVAGWKYVLDLEKLGVKIDKLKWDELHNNYEVDSINQIAKILGDGIYVLPWDYAKSLWNLTEVESTILFDVSSTLSEQFFLLDLFQRGKRVANEEVLKQINFNIYSKLFDN